MIAKNKKGGGFRGVLNYAIEKDGAELIGSNMTGSTPKELATEFGAVRNLRPNLGKAVLHVSLSAAEGERLTDQQWQGVAQKYLDGMGFTDNQFAMVRHTDTEHDHVHLIINRITSTGDVVSDSKDYQRQEKIMREVEIEYGLARVLPSAEVGRKAPTRNELEKFSRTAEGGVAEVSTRSRLQTLADACAKDCDSYTEYAQRLEAVGVELIPYTQMDDTKLNGLMYRLDGEVMKGSNLGKAYSPSGLAKQGVTYVKDRDVQSIRTAVERESHRAAQNQDHRLEKSPTPERGGTGGLDRPLGVSPSPVDGGELRIHPADRLERQTDQPANERDTEPSPASRGRDAAIRVDHHPESGRNSGSGSTGRNASYQRIVRLGRSQPPTRSSQSRSAGRSDLPRTSDTERESRTAAQQQLTVIKNPTLAALPLKRRSKGYRATAQGDIKPHWVQLQRQNALGAPVQLEIRQSNHIVVENLDAKAIERMAKDGLPAVSVTQKNGNHTALIRINDHDNVPRQWQTVIADHIQKTYGGRAKVEANIPLAGFDGVKLVSTADITAPRGLVILKDLARQQHEHEKAQALAQEKTHRWGVVEKTIHAGTVYGAEREYIKLAGKLHDKRHDSGQVEQIDTKIAKDLLIAGFDGKDVTAAIEKRSPNIEALKNSSQYAQNRTEQALGSREVQNHIQEQERAKIEKQRNPDRGSRFER